MTHNMVMEHFEVHKEQLEDLIVDLHHQGPKILLDLPVKTETRGITMNELALIDEMSGLTDFLDAHL